MVSALLAIALLSGPVLTVNPGKVLHAVSPDLYGVFFEEINNAGDGGLYAELVRNGRFEDSESPDHWKPFGGARIEIVESFDPRVPGNALKVTGPAGSGVVNEGYWGMVFGKGEEYSLSLNVRGEVPLSVALQNDAGKGAPIEWADHSRPRATFRSTVGTTNGRLALTLAQGGSVVLDNVSLFPIKTWKGRSNGLRPDLARMLDDLKPAFVRFPGGCWVEGDTCATSLRWKQTIGPVHQRRTQANLWNYSSGNGLGYHEYLQLCEDLGAKAMFVINCGMAHKDVIPMDKMDEYVEDALDAIEYANGPVTSKWGAERAKNGHPEPFNLVYLEIGNENGGAAYAERYPLFVKAISAKYPEVRLIANVWGGVPTTAKVDIVDEHYYSTPDFFMQNADKYDTYDRSGPKVYVGEYAVTQNGGNGNLRAALGEAAFMTGMERNSDIVVMSSYAPLFANVNNKAWNPDLIYFDNHRVCGTPSYYVQQLFSLNRPDHIVDSRLTGSEGKRGTFPDGGVGVGTWATQAEFKDIQVLQGGRVVFATPDGTGLKVEGGQWDKVEGAIRQTTDETPTRGWLGDQALREYTLTLKAKKISGAEGFLITVGRRDKDNYLWWNIGGWGNSQHAIELARNGSKSLVGKQKPGKVETGRWYDIRVDYSPERIVCRLDGQVVFDEAFPVAKSLFHVVGKTASGELVIKLVNVSEQPQDVSLDLGGGEVKSGTWVLFTGGAQDENTLDSPKKVFPVKRDVKPAQKSFRLPPNSLNVLRLRLKP